MIMMTNKEYIVGELKDKLKIDISGVSDYELSDRFCALLHDKCEECEFWRYSDWAWTCVMPIDEIECETWMTEGFKEG